MSAAGDQDYGFFVSITETALELDTIFCSAAHHIPHSSRPQSGAVPSSINASDPHPMPKPPLSLAPNTTGQGKSGSVPHEGGSSKVCTNCGKCGHLLPTCFEPGGGMEGRRDEYRRDRNRMVAMLVALLDEACGMEDDSSSEESGIVPFPHLSEPPPIDPSLSTFSVTAYLSRMIMSFVIGIPCVIPLIHLSLPPYLKLIMSHFYPWDNNSMHA